MKFVGRSGEAGYWVVFAALVTSVLMNLFLGALVLMFPRNGTRYSAGYSEEVYNDLVCGHTCLDALDQLGDPLKIFSFDSGKYIPVSEWKASLENSVSTPGDTDPRQLREAKGRALFIYSAPAHPAGGRYDRRQLICGSRGEIRRMPSGKHFED